MTYEVHFDKMPSWYPDQTTEVSKFDNPKEALDHAHNHLHSPSGDRLPYYGLRIHDTSNGYWLTYAQFNYWIETGQYFGPFVLKADGSIV